MAGSKPYVILSAAMSIDGKIATRTGKSGFSSQRDLTRLHKLRSTVDAILVGRNTVSHDNPSLTVRYATGKDPTRIILDPGANISPTSKIVKTARKIRTMVVVLESAPERKVSKLVGKEVNVIRCGRGRIDLEKLLKILAEKGIKKIIVEGGGQTNWHFLKEKLVDEILVTIAPYVVGGSEAVSLVGGHGFDDISYSFKLNQVKKMGNELVLRYLR